MKRSHHKEKKNSNAHKRHSASVCKHFFFSRVFLRKPSIRFFLLALPFFFLVFHDSSVLTSRYPVKVDLRAFVHSCFYLSHHLPSFVLHQSECSPRRRGASHGHQSVGDCQSEPKNFNIYCGKTKRTVFGDRRPLLLADNFLMCLRC